MIQRVGKQWFCSLNSLYYSRFGCLAWTYPINPDFQNFLGIMYPSARFNWNKPQTKRKAASLIHAGRKYSVKYTVSGPQKWSFNRLPLQYFLIALHLLSKQLLRLQNFSIQFVPTNSSSDIFKISRSLGEIIPLHWKDSRPLFWVCMRNNDEAYRKKFINSRRIPDIARGPVVLVTRTSST